MTESVFQSFLIKAIKKKFPGCIVIKTDPTYIQGLPDLLVLFKDCWGAFEVKRSAKAHHQPNQDFYISKMNGMSFARFISPENYEEVLNAFEAFVAGSWNFHIG